MKKQTRTLPHLSLHHLIVALSYWGTTARVLLLTFIALAVFVLQALEQASGTISLSQAFLTEGQMFIYAIGSFLILDAGYVSVAKGYAFRRSTDQIALLGTELIVSVAYFLPYFAFLPNAFVLLSQWIFVVALVVVSLRLLIGVLFGSPQRR